jgi:hypothetical protein
MCIIPPSAEYIYVNLTSGGSSLRKSYENRDKSHTSVIFAKTFISMIPIGLRPVRLPHIRNDGTKGKERKKENKRKKALGEKETKLRATPSQSLTRHEIESQWEKIAGLHFLEDVSTT